MSNEFVARKGLISLQTSSFKEDVYVSGSLQVGTFLTSSHLTVSGSAYISEGLTVDGGLTASQFVVTNLRVTETTSLTGSVSISGSQSLIGDITSIGSFTHTGSFLVSGSTIQIGNNTLLGNTLLSGSLIISGAAGANNPTIKIYGDTQHDGYIRFDPVSTNIDPNISASYIYVSGSTNDLYFTQNSDGYNNTTRLRWLEGNLYTGLLHGGRITVQTGSTWFSVSSGSGIIVSLNSSLNTDPYPTIEYVNWGNFISQSLTYLSSSIQTYIGIGSGGQLLQQTTPYINGEFNTKILVGTVLHQNKSTVNASITYPNLAYGYKQRTYDFVKAFGPLRLSGLNLVTTGSLGLNVGSGTAWADGRNYQTDPNNPSYIIDPGTAVSKIFRYYQSGSEFVQDTNGGLGYTEIDPTKYVVNGVLTNVGGDYSIQRVFWYPNSATKGIVVYYGNSKYNTIRTAIDNINIEVFNEVENTKQNAVFLGSIIIAGNGNFTNSNSYSIIPSGLFRSIGGSGGGGNIPTSRLSDLTDVFISGPTNGQPLVYNNVSLKWENNSTLTANLVGNASTSTTASYAFTASYIDGGFY